MKSFKALQVCKLKSRGEEELSWIAHQMECMDVSEIKEEGDVE